MKLLKYAFALLICVFMFSVSGHKAFAGSCSSVAGTSWNTGASWSAGCTGAGGIPGTNDDVTIAVGHPITLDVATASLNSMHIYSTLDTSGSNFALNMNGTQGTLYIESGGVLNANGSTITIGGFFYDQLGTFNAGTSTVTFTLNGSTTIIYGSPTFYNLSFTPTLTGTGDYTLNGSSLTVNNNMTFNPTAGSSQVLNATMGNTISVTGAVSVGGSGSATTVFNTNGQTLSTGTLTITSAGTLTAGASTINITGTSGTLFTKSGTFTAGTSTMNFSGNGTATLVSGTPTFYNLTSSGTGTKSQGGAIAFASGGTLSVTNGTYNPQVAPGITADASNTLSVTNATVNAVTAFEVDFPFGTKTLGAGSTINYNEGSPQTIYQGVTYVNLTISGATTKTLSGTTTATGVVTIASATLDTGSNYTLNAGSLVISVGATLNANGSTINITGTSGTLMSTGSSGVGINYGTSTFNFSGDGDATIGGAAQMNFYNLTSSGTGTKSLGAGGLVIRNGGTLSVTNGAFNPGLVTIQTSGTTTLSVGLGAALYVGEATFSDNYNGFTTRTLNTGSTVMYTQAGDQTIDHTLSYYNLATDGSGTKSINGDTTVTNALALYGGVFSNATHTLSVGHILINGGGFTPGAAIVNITGTSGTLFAYTSGTLSASSATINLTGNGDATFNTGGVPTFATLTSSGTGTKTLGADLYVSTAFTITNGTFNPATHTIDGSTTASLSLSNATLGVDAISFLNNYLGFTSHTIGTGSTVNFNGTGTQFIDNTITYYNLAITGASREVDFEITGVTTVSHAFTASGSAGSLISLFSSTAGTQWVFNPLGTATVSYVAVKDGACSATAVTVTQTSLTDLGHNDSCWAPAVAVAQAHSNGGVPLGLIAARAQILNQGANSLIAQKSIFGRTLTFGSKGADVTALQKILVKDGVLVMTNEGDYGFFGKRTLAAVKAFQIKHFIVKAGAIGYGMFGPKTQAEANKI